MPSIPGTTMKSSSWPGKFVVLTLGRPWEMHMAQNHVVSFLRRVNHVCSSVQPRRDVGAIEGRKRKSAKNGQKK